MILLLLRQNKLLKVFCLLVLLACSGAVPANDVNNMERLWYLYNRRAAAYMQQKDTLKALSCYDKARALLEENDASNTGLYVKTITDLGKFYYNIQNKDAFNEISRITDKLVDTDYSKISKRGISLLKNIAQYYTFVGEGKKACEILEQLIERSNAICSKKEHAQLLHTMAFVKYMLGDIASAIEYELNAIGHYKLPESYRCLCWYYYKTNDVGALQGIISDAFVLSREPVLQHFVKSTGVERARYWASAGSFFNRFIPQFALDNPTDELCSITYDAILLSKGMLLNADVTAADIINSSGDSVLIADFNRFKLLSDKGVLTLAEAADKDYLQEMLVKKQKMYTNKFRSGFRYSWKDVQSALNEGDIAIEFTSIGDVAGSEYMVALVVDKTCLAPAMIKLCPVNELAGISPDELYTTSKIYNLIWEPIFSKAGACQNIYFSPSGLIHNIAIEYSADNDGLELLSLYNIHRLSSTRQIVKQNTDTNLDKFVLLGGVNYNNENQSPISVVRGGVNYLPATKLEVDSIAKMLSNSDAETTLLCGNDASETRVKALANLDNDIIHLATHGFYISSSREAVFPSLNSLVSNSLVYDTESKDNATEDMSLAQSGLLLAGANTTLLDDAVEEDKDDGVLYASELATINLHKAKVLVLSACETALGDLSFSEGVFGLQRGFKLAGGKSIVMSLWKIDDMATMVFMCSLYNNIKTMPLNEAFNAARMDLRMVDDGRWDNPEFYNAFILLDAI